ncbi:MAG: mechanosensitive ion channel [Myxococcales bacterium]|nr:mechanosensitive ion channel [Myxococcales bacterium]
MSVLTTFLETAWAARTPFLIVGYLLVRALGHAARSAPGESRRGRAGLLLAGHVLAIAVAAAQQSYGYGSQAAQIAALAFAALCLVSLGTRLVFQLALPRLGVGVPRILIDIVTAVAVAIAFIIVGKRAGFSVTGLITTSAVLTAVIGFALQDTLGNIMGGLAVQLDNTVRIGDWISLGPGQPAGRVAEIRWRYTAIETRAWETIIVPNGMLTKSQVLVHGRRSGQPIRQRRQVEFFVDFRTPPTRVIHVMEAALRGSPVPNMAQEPLPHVLFTGLRDSVAAYQARFWLEDIALDEPTDSAVRTRMWFAARRAQIPLAIPASAVFLTAETAEREQRKSSEELASRLTALHNVDLFRALPENSAAALAHSMSSLPYGAGEVITREGAQEDELYILVSGSAAVRIGEGAALREVARLGAGKFFGEMSLMTGEARTATVVALDEVQCYRIDKESFQRVLHDSPQLAEQIAEILANRREALTAAKDEASEHLRHRLDRAKRDLLGRIRGFFGLAGGGDPQEPGKPAR